MVTFQDKRTSMNVIIKGLNAGHNGQRFLFDGAVVALGLVEGAGEEGDRSSLSSILFLTDPSPQSVSLASVAMTKGRLLLNRG